MKIEEAKANIGQPFKLNWIKVLSGKFDIIREVDIDGWIIGDFLEAPAQDCRLKAEQPEQLKKKQPEDDIPTELYVSPNAK